MHQLGTDASRTLQAAHAFGVGELQPGEVEDEAMPGTLAVVDHRRDGGGVRGVETTGEAQGRRESSAFPVQAEHA